MQLKSSHHCMVSSRESRRAKPESNSVTSFLKVFILITVVGVTHNGFTAQDFGAIDNAKNTNQASVLKDTSQNKSAPLKTDKSKVRPIIYVERDTVYYPPVIEKKINTGKVPEKEKFVRWWLVKRTRVVGYTGIPLGSATDSSIVFYPQTDSAFNAWKAYQSSIKPLYEVEDSDTVYFPLWTKIYGEGGRQFIEEKSPKGNVLVQVGKRLFRRFPLDFFCDLRASRDLLGISLSNRIDVGCGFRYQPVPKSPLSIYLEGLLETYIDYHDSSTVGLRSDFLSDDINSSGKTVYIPSYGSIVQYDLALLYTKNWGERRKLKYSTPLMPYRWWGIVYSELVFTHRQYNMYNPTVDSVTQQFAYKRNTRKEDKITLYFNPKFGIVLLEGKMGSFIVGDAMYLWVSTALDWWDNKVMAGPLVRYVPFADIDLGFDVGFMFGTYLGLARKDEPNPYPKSFATLRLALTFDYSLGL